MAASTAEIVGCDPIVTLLESFWWGLSAGFRGGFRGTSPPFASIGCGGGAGHATRGGRPAPRHFGSPARPAKPAQVSAFWWLTQWQSIGTATADSNGNFEFEDPTPANLTHCYYRVALP